MSKYQEVDNMKNDAASIQNNAVDLTHRLAGKAAESIDSLAQNAKSGYETAKDFAASEIKTVETFVKEKPVQSILIAFGAGILLQMITGRK